jgi:hypothetical protein
MMTTLLDDTDGDTDYGSRVLSHLVSMVLEVGLVVKMSVRLDPYVI